LSLGYIGVVNSPVNANPTAMIRSEEQYFRRNPIYNPSSVGSGTLRRKLMIVLEERMTKSLSKIIDHVQNDLEDARYEFKVHYNDRFILPESYVAECIDILKAKFKDFTRNLDKHIVKDRIRDMLEKKMVNLSAEHYWNAACVAELYKDHSDVVLETKLTNISAKLTRSGVGKSSVDLVVEMIAQHVGKITSAEPWSYHSKATDQVFEFAIALLKSKYHAAIDQVENTIKPYKFEVDASDLEWKDGQKRATEVLHQEMKKNQIILQMNRSRSGRRKFKNAMKYLAYVEEHPEAIDLEAPFTEKELSEAKDAMNALHHSKVLSQRLSTIQSRQCGYSSSKALCPEVFLAVVSEKLASTAVQFIYIELLNEFFFQLPRQIDNKMYYSLSKDDILEFCKENPLIHQHLKAQERKQTLESVMEKLQLIARSSN
jgi:hypothetical protein